jgi:hypothetical protein
MSSLDMEKLSNQQERSFLQRLRLPRVEPVWETARFVRQLSTSPGSAEGAAASARLPPKRLRRSCCAGEPGAGSEGLNLLPIVQLCSVRAGCDGSDVGPDARLGPAAGRSGGGGGPRRFARQSLLVSATEGDISSAPSLAPKPLLGRRVSDGPERGGKGP